MIQIELVKQHLRLEPEFMDDNELIEVYIAAALESASLYIGQELEEPLSPSIKAGCLMFIGTMYTTRQDVTELQRHAVPTAVERLWNVHRTHGVY